MTRKAIAVLALVLAGSCARTATTTAPTTTVQPAPVVTTGAVRPTVTIPDLTDVDKVLASVDSDIARADHDVTNEGAPTQ